MKQCTQRSLMFVGAVIGAGFASGREVVSFFSQYGNHSWWLILLSTAIMAGLCCLCLHHAGKAGCCQWCALFDRQALWVQKTAKGCVLLLQVVMSGAMISAAGHLTALVLPMRSAYFLGMLVTIGLALLVASGNLRYAAELSRLLSLLFVFAILAVLVFDGGEDFVAATQGAGSAAGGALRAVAYAAMNLTLAVGVICKCSDGSCCASNRLSVLFGCLMTGLLFLSNYLYLKHPELENAAFPMIVLLRRFGILGFWTGLLLMYLAILTSLAAGLLALRSGLEDRLSRPAALALTVLLPLVVSFAGFEGLVDQWYAPVGLLCLVLVFGPLLLSRRRKNAS